MNHRCYNCLYNFSQIKVSVALLNLGSFSSCLLAIHLESRKTIHSMSTAIRFPMALAPASEVVMSTELYDEKIPSGLSKAVQVAKDSPNLPPAVKTMLEKEVGNLWRRIQARPETYIMSKEEFAFFNYYRGRYHAENIAQHAVARFWTNYRDSSSTVEGAESSKVARWNSLRAPPPGFLGPAQRSTAWQDSLDGTE